MEAALKKKLYSERKTTSDFIKKILHLYNIKWFSKVNVKKQTVKVKWLTSKIIIYYRLTIHLLISI